MPNVRQHLTLSARIKDPSIELWKMDHPDGSKIYMAYDPEDDRAITKTIFDTYETWMSSRGKAWGKKMLKQCGYEFIRKFKEITVR